ncbi:hypothetical protein F383_21548 [Gossypium arboreum]|uniref:Uncharacterized protein n=1 Tax=Gossypium arboreum TaxID=29729 RepID=A0A0B0NVL3_GOSAR|nr:hypothetical protein F383_21548 [Gossypium arboreum]
MGRPHARVYSTDSNTV